MSDIRQIMEQIAALGDSQRIRTCGFLERFVLQYGHEFTGPAELPSDIERGPMGQCFGNAALLAMARPELYVYTEGYAMAFGMPFQHGWVTDRQGRVIDPTWTSDTEYFGVLIKHKYVRSRMGLSMIDNWQNDWHLVTHSRPSMHLVELEKWILSPAPERVLA